MKTEHFKLHHHKSQLNRTDAEAPPAGKKAEYQLYNRTTLLRLTEGRLNP